MEFLALTFFYDIGLQTTTTEEPFLKEGYQIAGQFYFNDESEDSTARRAGLPNCSRLVKKKNYNLVKLFSFLDMIDMIIDR